MNTTIVGLGLIGGSLAKDLRERKLAKTIVGVEHNPIHAKKALELGLVDEIQNLKDALAKADLVVLSVPVGFISDLLHNALDLIQPTATVTDMGSTKYEIGKAVASHPRRKNYVASHPMAGTEHSGPEAALARLFDGKTAVICDQDLSAPLQLKLIEDVYKAIGARVIYMNSLDHDLHVAYVSHLSHISSFVLANTVLDKEKNETTIFNLASGGFESTVRLAKSSPGMWAPIFEQNRDFVVEALNAYIEHLEIFKSSIANQDFKKTASLMERANQIRGILDNINPASIEQKK